MNDRLEDSAREPQPQVLDITVRTGSGTGRTVLSSFDHALQLAGVADFNLVTLSSVIPPGSRVRMVNAPLPGDHGDVLFCVRAQAYAEHPGDIVWAGIGWCVDETGGGLFVEHHGGSEQSVTEQIELSLGDMNARRGGGYGKVHTALASAHCVDEPACALVIAAYRVSSWFDEQPEKVATEEIARVPSVKDKAIRVTMETEVAPETAAMYYQLYRDTFGDLETRAVARQLLHESEFLEEMHDPRVQKYVAWSPEGEIIGISTLTSELATVPWISPAYFAHHYPEHAARGAIFYLGFTLVRRDQRRGRVFQAMVEKLSEVMIEARGVCAWDICLHNDEVLGLGANITRMIGRFADVTVAPIDRQTYYGGTIHGPIGDIASSA